MSVGYVSAGTRPDTSQFNALAGELEKALHVLFSGHSWLCFDFKSVYAPPLGKPFFFGDDAQWKIINSFPFFTTTAAPYDHAPFTAAAAAMTVYDHDETKELAYVDSGTWPLDDSLEAHTREIDVGGGTLKKMWLTAKPPTAPPDALVARERRRKLDVAEIIIEGWNHSLAFTWGTAYDKFHFLRFHNLDDEALSVVLPGPIALTVPPFGIQATRRTYPAVDEWDQTYKYLWKAVSGDSLVWDGIRANNVSSLQCYHQWLDAHFGAIDGDPERLPAFFFDPRVVWDGSGILPQPIGLSVEAAKYYWHLGEILTFSQAATTGTALRGEPASWDEFLSATGTEAIGLKGVVASGALSIQAIHSTDEPVDAVGLGTNLIPLRPVTVPYAPPETHGSLAVGGATTQTLTVNAAYAVPDPETGGDSSVNVSFDQDGFAQVLPGWQIQPSFGLWSTLSALGDLQSANDPESLAKPTVNWKSDGWRLVPHGETTWPASMGVVPTTTPPADNPLWILSDTELKEPFGSDFFLRLQSSGNDWTILARRHSRALSDWVGYEVAATSTHVYTGNPDVHGHDGLPNGEDWIEERQPFQDSVVASQIRPPAQIATHTLPVRPRQDSADRIVANAETPGWYPTHRANLKAGVLEDADIEQLVRVPIFREHYNHVAQRLNSLTAIRPFMLLDVIYYGNLNDGTDISPNPYHPKLFFCAVATTGSRAAELGLVPQTTVINGATMKWISATQVQALAENLTFPFFLERSAAAAELHGDLSTSGAWSFTPTDDFTSDWRVFLRGLSGIDQCLVLKFGTLPSGDLTLPKGAGYPAVLEPSFEVQRWYWQGFSVAGWALDLQSRVLTVPWQSLGYVNDPLSEDPYSFDGRYEQHEVVEAMSVTPKFWPLTSLEAEAGQISAQSIADTYGVTMPDPRCAFYTRLIKRGILTRALP